MKIQPYYIVPLLVEQPTWGGTYISHFKNIAEKKVVEQKIGQAYELAHESLLTSDLQSESFLYATATSIDQSERFGNPDTLALSDLIAINPELVLGKKCLATFGTRMPLLIKFTQALSNSYQVHVQTGQEFDHWLPKPESWYFFEKGKATLGLLKDSNVAEYRERCLEIHTFAQVVSQEIVEQKISLNLGRQKIAEFINENHPSNYVNTIYPEAGTVVDLSQGGTHHSWETDPNLPDGNIVYEVQLDVKDELCTLRSFDQGKVKDDGSIRSLTIDEYFKALSTDQSLNDPKNFLKPVATQVDQNATILTLFATPFYRLTNISFSGNYQGQETDTSSSGFQHLFVKKGSVTVHTQNGEFPLKTGWSLFIPANTGMYHLSAVGNAEILKTTV